MKILLLVLFIFLIFTLISRFNDVFECERCKGAGVVNGGICPDCSGSGYKN